MTDPIRAALETAVEALERVAYSCANLHTMAANQAANAAAIARTALAAEPLTPREALAARPLLEQLARMGDRIGQKTVGEIMAISERAAAWLAENPPGQPVAIEPRGCPTPGACSCLELPEPEPNQAPAADHIPAATKMVPARDGQLVRQVQIVIGRDYWEIWEKESRATILAVAKWLRSVGNDGSAAELEREAQR